MEKNPSCDRQGLKKGAWTEEEDRKLFAYVQQHGEGGWRSLPQKAGLLRCGKSCRLRWANYLRPGIKRGGISPEEEEIIIRLHASLGNRWSDIARHLYRRTDNEIKNYWHTNLKKRVAKMTNSTINTTVTTTDHHHESDHHGSINNCTGNLAPNANHSINSSKSNHHRRRERASSSCTRSIPTTNIITTTSSSARILNKIASKISLINLPRVVIDGSASESSSVDSMRPGSSVREFSPWCSGGGYSSGSPASSTPSNNADPLEDGSPAPVVPLSRQGGFSALCEEQVQLMCQQGVELGPDLDMLLSDAAANDIAKVIEDHDNDNDDDDSDNNNIDDLEQMLVTSFPNGFFGQQT